jgi:V/A-type H+-transporting ATPase subunit I
VALQSISKVRVFVPSQKEEKVLSFLQEKGLMEFVSVKSELRVDIDHSAEFAVAKLDFAIRYLGEYTEKKKGMRNAVLGEKVEVSEEKKQEIVSSFDWESVVSSVAKIESGRNDIVRELLESKLALSALGDFGAVDIASKEGDFSPSFFVLPLKGAEKFEEDVKNISPYLELLKVDSSEKNVSFVLFAQREVRDEVLILLSQYKGSEIVLEEGLSPALKMKKLAERIDALELQLKENEELARGMTENIYNLKVVYDFFDAQKDVRGVLRGVEKTDFISVLEGWIEENRISEIKNALGKEFGAVEIERLALKEGESAPVLLKNASMIEPFEVVTNMYGAPQSNELDPTPFLAPFFVVFFGLCLTDAAYGLMLASAMGAVLLANLPIDLGVKKMVKLLFFSGLSTAFFGVLFGGWFGISPEAVSSSLTYVNASGETMFLGQIVNPTADLVDKIAPLILLGGLLHLLLGVGMRGYLALKNNNKWDMWMVSLPTIVTISLGVLAIIGGMFGLSESFQSVLMNVIVVSFAIMTIGIMKSGGPITWFMDVTGWLSNTLSYARLFALGLATGIVAQVFNTVAFTIGGMMPTGIDILIIVLIIVFGHTLNIALNLLGAFVHSGRLQFVEFFGQFLEGGGRYFSPLKKRSRFIYTSV